MKDKIKFKLLNLIEFTIINPSRRTLIALFMILAFILIFFMRF